MTVLGPRRSPDGASAPGGREGGTLTKRLLAGGLGWAPVVPHSPAARRLSVICRTTLHSRLRGTVESQLVHRRLLSQWMNDRSRGPRSGSRRGAIGP